MFIANEQKHRAPKERMSMVSVVYKHLAPLEQKTLGKDFVN